MGSETPAKSGDRFRGKQSRDTSTEDALQLEAVLQLQTLHHTHREPTRLFLMVASQGTTHSQIPDTLKKGLPNLTDPVSLQDKSTGKQPEVTGIINKDKQPEEEDSHHESNYTYSTTTTHRRRDLFCCSGNHSC